MRQFDLTPFYRSTIGFDRLLTLLDGVAGTATETTFPPYNIERLGDNQYRISMAVAGFGADDLKVEIKEQLLTISGNKSEESKERAFVHRGIASRSFERRFQLADYVEVNGADLRDGMLHIDLVRNVPEKLKPRTVAIGVGTSTEAPKVIEHAKAVAA